MTLQRFRVEKKNLKKLKPERQKFLTPAFETYRSVPKSPKFLTLNSEILNLNSEIPLVNCRFPLNKMRLNHFGAVALFFLVV